jgi:predicted TIM-barrel fold metal-dependent hydrolase
VWEVIDAAGIAVAYHASDGGYFRYFKDYDDPGDYNAFTPANRLGSLWAVDRPMQDMVAAMIMQKLFERFPNLRIVSVELGASWLPVLIDRLMKQYKRRPRIFAEEPLETLRRHLWVCPFFEDDSTGLIESIGIDHVVFGSDWPHPEGLAQPRDFAKYLPGLNDEDLKKVMRDNGAALLTRRPR